MRAKSKGAFVAGAVWKNAAGGLPAGARMELGTSRRRWRTIGEGSEK